MSERQSNRGRRCASSSNATVPATLIVLVVQRRQLLLGLVRVRRWGPCLRCWSFCWRCRWPGRLSREMVKEIRGVGKRPGEFPSGQLLFDAFMGHCCAFAPNFKPTCGMLLQALKSLLREPFEAFFGAISTRAQELLRFPAYENEGAKEHEEEATFDLKASFQPFAA